MSSVPDNAGSIQIRLFYGSRARYSLTLDSRESVLKILTRAGERSITLGENHVSRVMSYLCLLTPKFGNPVHDTEFDLTIESFEFSAIIKWNGEEDTPRHLLARYIHEVLGA
jgi:hypothetical protein